MGQGALGMNLYLLGGQGGDLPYPLSLAGLEWPCGLGSLMLDVQIHFLY